MSKHSKPRKPRPDWPLFPHNNGQWAKKINGKFRYFGPWEDPEAALQRYAEERDDLYAGRTPARRGMVALGPLVKLFLESKSRAVDSGDLSERSYYDYSKTCLKMLEGIGSTVAATDLTPADWESYRSWLARTLSPGSLGNEIVRTRVVMKWGVDQKLIEPPDYGQSFHKPSKLAVRRHKRSSGTSKYFSAWEVRRILEAAPATMKAFVLLGLNCGFGQTDIAGLTSAAVQGDWVVHPRSKTEVDRRCPLWPETVQAIEDAARRRPAAAGRESAGLLFLTRQGARWVRHSEAGKPIDSLSSEFAKLLAKIDRDAPRCLRPIQQRGRGFYSLRHVFQTVGEESGDLVAVKAIMGHVDDSMSAVYRERISDERLLHVANTVRRWLFPADGQ